MIHGSRKIRLTVAGESFVIKPLWDEAPKLCQTIWDNLPVVTAAMTAKLCSHELMFVAPFVAERENMQKVVPGLCGWWDSRACFNVFFGNPGPNGPLGLTAAFGVIEGDLDGLDRLARQIFSRPCAAVRVERCEE